MKQTIFLLPFLFSALCFAESAEPTFPSDSEALTAIYGPTKDNVATWTLNAEEAADYAKLSQQKYVTGDQLKCKIQKRMTVYMSSKKGEFVVFNCAENESLIGNDCHACTPAIGIALFQGKNILAMKKALMFAGQWGIAAEPQLTYFSDNHPGIIFENVHTGMGSKSMLRTVVAPFEKSFKVVANLEQSMETNMFDCNPSKKNCFYYDSFVKFTPHKGSDFGKMSVLKVGTELKDNKVVSVQKVSTYAFDGSEYKIEK
jgi:hypothetical protein